MWQSYDFFEKIHFFRVYFFSAQVLLVGSLSLINTTPHYSATTLRNCCCNTELRREDAEARGGGGALDSYTQLEADTVALAV